MIIADNKPLTKNVHNVDEENKYSQKMQLLIPLLENMTVGEIKTDIEQRILAADMILDSEFHLLKDDDFRDWNNRSLPLLVYCMIKRKQIELSEFAPNPRESGDKVIC